MKSVKLIFISAIIMLIVFQGCEETSINTNGYINLELAGFFKLPEKEIVDSLASLLSLSNFYFSDTTNPSFESISMGGIEWINSGNKYENPDGHSIMICYDSEGSIAYVTYLDYRHCISSEWVDLYSQYSDYLGTLFQHLGMVQTNNEIIGLEQYAAGVKNQKWYQASCAQTFNSDTLIYPSFEAEMEGDTCKINFMKLPVWYNNLGQVSQNLTDIELLDTAITYYQNDPDVLSIAEELYIDGYGIVHHKLCAKIERAIIDEYGSSMALFIDVQNGDLVEKQHIFVR